MFFSSFCSFMKSTMTQKGKSFWTTYSPSCRKEVSFYDSIYTCKISKVTCYLLISYFLGIKNVNITKNRTYSFVIISTLNASQEPITNRWMECLTNCFVFHLPGFNLLRTASSLPKKTTVCNNDNPASGYLNDMKILFIQEGRETGHSPKENN